MKLPVDGNAAELDELADVVVAAVTAIESITFPNENEHVDWSSVEIE